MGPTVRAGAGVGSCRGLAAHLSWWVPWRGVLGFAYAVEATLGTVASFVFWYVVTCASQFVVCSGLRGCQWV